jgi:hypothetical protein
MPLALVEPNFLNSPMYVTIHLVFGGVYTRCLALDLPYAIEATY